jgi:hypothetical protein
VPLLLDNGYSVGAPFYIGEGIFPSVPNFIPSQNIPPTPTRTNTASPSTPTEIVCPESNGMQAMAMGGPGGDVCQASTQPFVVTPTGSPTPTFTPSATATKTPTATPTQTPTPEQPVTVALGIPLPIISGEICAKTGNIQDRLPCAIESLNNYRTRFISENGRDMDWVDFIALIIFTEGHQIMLNGANPQDTYLNSLCWRWKQSDWDTTQKGWVSGNTHCNQFGIQQHFPHAVVEWILKECAIKLDYGTRLNVTYIKNGNLYNKQCDSNGLKSFLIDVESLYSDPDATNNVDMDMYRQVATDELAKWGVSKNYGQCPCSWGNVAGKNFDPNAPNPPIVLDDNNVPIYPTYSADDPRHGNAYNNNHSYSFFYSSQVGPANLPYFRIE